jgi:hypothetical protein
MADLKYVVSNRDEMSSDVQSDVEKRTEQSRRHEPALDVVHEDAVGYQQYLDGRDLEISDKEVCIVP